MELFLKHQNYGLDCYVLNYISDFYYRDQFDEVLREIEGLEKRIIRCHCKREFKYDEEVYDILCDIMYENTKRYNNKVSPWLLNRYSGLIINSGSTYRGSYCACHKLCENDNWIWHKHNIRKFRM